MKIPMRKRMTALFMAMTMTVSLFPSSINAQEYETKAGNNPNIQVVEETTGEDYTSAEVKATVEDIEDAIRDGISQGMAQSEALSGITEGLSSYASHLFAAKLSNDAPENEDTTPVDAPFVTTPDATKNETAITVDVKENKEQNLAIIWIDNDKGNRPADADMEDKLSIESFTINGKTLAYTKENAVKYLGMTDAEYDASLSFSKKGNTGTYDVYLVTLPSETEVTTTTTEKVTDEEGNETEVSNDTKVVYPVTWNIIQTSEAGDNYLVPQKTEEVKDAEGEVLYDNVWINREVSDAEFNVEIKQGNNTVKPSEFKGDLCLYATVNGVEYNLGALDSIDTKEAFKYIDATNNLKDAGVSIDDATGKITLTKLPKYNDDKIEIIYSVKAREDSDKIKDSSTSGDYYKPIYDNANSTNFSSNNTECHNNGTLKLILSGQTEYKAVKVWLDNGDVDRPAATFDLWRYSDRDNSNYQQAARSTQVQGKTETFDAVSGSAAGKSNVQIITFDEIDKYDPDGYEYVYISRESLNGNNSGSYEMIPLKSITIDGKVLTADDFNSASTSTISGITELTADNNGGYSRDPGDKSVYPGQIVANRITGTTELEWEKKWNAAYYQDDLNDVEVTLGVLYKPEDADDSEYKEYPTGTVTINGFTAENLLQSGTGSFPKYDELGRPLVYKYYEKSITQGGDNLLGADGKFMLDHNIAANKDGNYEYYISKTDVTGSKTSITNVLEGTTTYNVDKLWKDTVTGEYTKEAAPEGASVGVMLYQDGKTYSVGNDTAKDAQGNDVSFDTKGQITLSGDNNYYYEYTLPKFDKSGRAYNYYAMENQGYTGYYSDEQYDVNVNGVHYDCQIKNTPVEGDSKTIWVRKDWMDDGNEPTRNSVTVDIYRKALPDEEDQSDKYIRTVTLSKKDNWILEVGVLTGEDEGKASADLANAEYYIREVSMGTGSSIQYDIYKPITESRMTYSGFFTPATLLLADQGNASSHNLSAPVLFSGSNNAAATVDLVTVDGRKYEAYYMKDGRDYVVVNRRIGTVDIAVTKNWLDGKNEDNNRPDTVKVEVKPNGYDGYSSQSSISISSSDDKGIVTVNNVVGTDGIIYITDNSNNNVSNNQTMDTTEAKTYYFCNLPKYDALGRIIHYNITENNQVLPYAGSISNYTYLVNKTGTEDDITMNLVNKRVGTKNVQFNKIWKDVYAYENGLRPDIYLTLYKKVYNTANNEDGYTIVKVEPYPDRNWVHASGDNGDFIWACVFPDVEKYDSAGREIEYYALEDSKVNMSSIDYAEVELYGAVEGKDATSFTADNKDELLDTILNNGLSNGEKLDDRTLLPENGWFLNKLEGNVTIDGKKVWKNVPSGTPAADLPQLQILVNRSIVLNPSKGDIIETNVGIKTELDANKYNLSDYSNSFTITDKKDNEGIKLPKYDEEGHLYYYTVSEKVINATNENLNATYESLPGQVNNYIITNTYDTGVTENKSNTGYIKVTKNWSGLDTKIYKYPGIKFKLYRQYVSNDTALNTVNGKTEPELVDTKVISTGTVLERTIDFDSTKIRTYAPNGNLYYYYIEETILDGYEANEKPELTMTARVDVGTVENTTKENPADAKFKNTYSPKKVTISGNKVWKDYGNAFNTRPDSITISVYRYADAQKLDEAAGGDAAEAINPGKTTEESFKVDISDTESQTDPYISWTQSGDTWTYTIHNLDKYAPNSMPWKYIVKETPVTGYTCENETVEAKDASKYGTDSVEMKDINNNFYTTATIVKKWAGQGNVDIQPARIQVKLQYKYKTGTDTAWKDSYGTAFDNAATTGTAVKFDGTYYVDTTAFDEDATFEAKNLPSMIDGKAVEWRFIECAIGSGDRPVTVDGNVAGDTVTYNQSGAYQPTQVYDAANKTTTITNTLQGVSVAVDKTWNDKGLNGTTEEDNRYNTRPTSITVKLQRQIKEDGKALGTNWVDATDINGNIITAELNSTNNWEYEFTGLRLDAQEKGTDGADVVGTYVYRVVETDVPEGYKDTYDYNGDTISDKKYTTKITNSLNDRTKITVTKEWKDYKGDACAPAAGTTAYFEIVKVSNGKEVSFNPAKIITLDSTNALSTGTEWSTQITDLPVLPGITYKAIEMVKNSDGTYTSAPASGYWKSEATTKIDKVSDDANDTYSSTITNTQTWVSLDKLGTDGAAIANNYSVVYKIYKKGTTTVLATWTKTKNGTTVTETLTDNAAGISFVAPSTDTTGTYVPGKMVGLPLGEYTLKETTAPAGYETAQDVNFKINADGTVTLATGTTNASTANKLISLKDEPIKINVNKTDTSGKAISYANFEVTGVFADASSSATKKITTNTTADGDYKLLSTLDGLWVAGNTYTFVEKKAPDGYEVTSTTVLIKIKADGTIDTVTNTPSTDVIGSASTDTLSIKNNEIELTLKKVTSLTGNAALSGAQFELKDKSTSKTKTLTVGADGVTMKGTDANVPLIAGHTYVLTEKVAPNGYILPASDAMTFEFTVADDGTIKAAITSPASYSGYVSGAADQTVITVKNDPIKLQLIKQGENDTKTSGKYGYSNITGAVFTLKDDADADSTRTVTIGTDGTIVLAGTDTVVPIIQGHSYTLSETTVPAGYVRMADIKFTVDAQGGVSLAATRDDVVISSASGYTSVITAKNDKTQFTLKKFDGTTELADSRLELTVKQGDNTVFKWKHSVTPAAYSISDVATGYSTISIESSTGLIRGLPVGTYTVYETSTPYGYETAAPVTFVVGADGSVKIGTTEPDGKIVGVNDNKIEVKLVKTDGTNAIGSETIGYAEFDVTGVFADETSEVTKKISTDPTAANNISSLTGKWIAGNTYKFEETKAPAGYELSTEDIYVTVSDAGLVTVPSTTNTAATLTDTVTVSNSEIKITLKKTNATGTSALAGAQFTLTDITDAAATTKPTTTVKTGTTGTVTLSGTDSTAPMIYGHTYTLTETVAPDGYIVPKSGDNYALTVTFKVKSDGTLEVVSVPDAFSGYVSTNNDSLTVKNDPVKVVLKKEDTAGTALAGAVFTVKDNATNASHDYTIATSGTTVTGEDANVPMIKGHTYTVHEKTVPAGYVRCDDFTFSINEKGQVITTASDTKVKVTNDSSTVTTTGITNTVEVYNTKTEMYLGKIDGSDDSEIIDSKLELTVKQGNTTVFKWTHSGSPATYGISGLATGSTISINTTTGLISGLPAGTYTVSETSTPDGYETAQSVEFTLGEDGSVKVNNTALADKKVNLVDNKISLSLVKTDGTNAIGSDTIGYAEFDVTGIFADSTSEATKHISTAPTATNNISSLTGMWIAGKTYTFVETKAPNGYELDTTAFTVTVDAAGKATVSGSNVSANNDTITVSNKVIEITLSKATAITGGTLLSGAQFTLTDETAAAKPTTTVTTGTDGKVTLSGTGTVPMINGHTYTLTETVAPDGYILPSGLVITFKVASDGTLVENATVAGIASSYVSALADTDEIIVVNDPTTIVISKKDFTSDAVLSGIEFFIKEKNAAGDAASTGTTGTDGSLTINNLVQGKTYELYEGRVSGYQSLEAPVKLLEITMNTDGSATISGVNSDRVTASTSNAVTGNKLVVTLTIKNKRIPGTINITKVDNTDDNTKLSGAQFTLYKKNTTGQYTDADKVTTVFDGTSVTGNRTGNPVTTGTDGTASFTGLEWGDYVLVETTAPDGYKLNTTKFEFTIGENTSYEVIASRKVINTKNDLTFGKYDFAAQTTALTGAVYTITPAAGSKFAANYVPSGSVSKSGNTLTVTIGSTKPKIDGCFIAGNTYILTETTAPAGYEKNADSVQFTMNTDGTVTVASNTMASYASGELKLYDNKTSFTFEKYDSRTDFAIDKTKFEFTLAGTFADSTTSKVVTPDASLTGLLIAGNTYVLSETKVASGYNKVENVSLKVSDDGKTISVVGTNEAVATDENAVKVTNVYSATGKLTLTGTKTLYGRNYKTGETFSYEVYENSTKVATGTSASNGVITFTDINYTLTDVGTHTYTVKEVNDKKANVTYDTTEYTVEVSVTDNGDGTLTVTQPSPVDIKFSNVYEAVGSIDLTGKKTVKDNDMSTFTFGIFTDESCTKTLLSDVSNNTAGNYKFTVAYTMADFKNSDGTYARSKEFTYYVKETGSKDSYTYDKSVYKVVVTVTNNYETGTLDTNYTVAKKAENAAEFVAAADSLDFVNQYNAAGSISFEGTKYLSGHRAENMHDREFTFLAVLLDDNGNETTDKTAGYNFAEGHYSATENKIVFNSIKYTEADINKSYIYKITETSGSDATIGYSEKVYYAKTTITNPKQLVDGKGVLNVAVEYYSDMACTTKATFEYTNEYNASGEITLNPVNKVLNGANLKKDQFEFSLMQGTTVIDTVKNDATGKAVFKKLSYTQADIGKTYTYTVVENGTTSEGITYDTNSYTVTVSVTDGGNGQLNITATQADTFTFTNNYTAEGSFTLDGNKQVTNGNLIEGFEFSIYDENDNALAVNVADTTVANAADGKFAFTFNYTQEDLLESGVYKTSKDFTYYIRERETTFPGYTNDSRVYKLVLTVTNPHTGAADKQNLVVSVKSLEVSTDNKATFTNATAVLFTNSYKAEGKNEIAGHKNVTHANMQEGFVFGIYENFDKNTGTLSNPAAATVEDTTLLNDDKGDFAFKLSYDMSDMLENGKTDSYVSERTFTYYIAEDSLGENVGYTKDTSVYKVEVKVVNQINAEGKPELVVDSKKVYNFDSTNKTFSEALGGVTFTNDYPAVTTAEVEGIKVVADNDLSEFTYGIFTDEACTVKPNDGTVTATEVKNNTTDGTFAFDFSFDMEDMKSVSGYLSEKTFTYYIKEITTESEKPSYGFDQSVYKVEIKLTDDGKGNLTAVKTVTKKSAGESAFSVYGTNLPVAFINYYKAEGTTHFEADKVLTGNRVNAIADGEFTFTAECVSETINHSTGSVAASQLGKKYSGSYKADSAKVVFENISFTEADIDNTYIYKLTENKGSDTAITYSNEVYYAKVSVTNPKTVGNDNKGQLTIEVTYYTDENCETQAAAVTYTNAYTAAGTAMINPIAKELLGRNVETEEFTFVLKNEAGDVIQTVKNDADAAVWFDDISYTQEDIGKTFVYTVSEVLPNAEGVLDGVTYDASEYTITVEVSDNGNGTLKVDVTQANETIFTNQYKALGTVTIPGIKAVTNGNLVEGFRFTVLDINNKPAVNAANQTVTNDASGDFEFELSFNEEDLRRPSKERFASYYTSKDFTYYIVEEDSTKPGYTKDGKIYRVVVTVENNQAELAPAADDKKKLDTKIKSIEVSEDGGNTYVAASKVEFVNDYEAEGELEIRGKKNVTHANISEGFVFSIFTDFDTRTGKASNLASDTVKETVVKNDENGQFIFTLEYIMADLYDAATGRYLDEKTFTYYIAETSLGDGHPSYTKDDTVYKVTVKAVNNAGTIEVTDKTIKVYNSTTKTFEDETGISFTNDYPVNITERVEGIKAVTDNDMSAFEYGIFADDACTQKVTDNTVVSDETANDENGRFAFEFAYSMDDLKEGTIYLDKKTFTYYVKEISTKTDIPSYSFDQSVYKLEITVTNDKKNGKLVTEKKISKKAAGKGTYDVYGTDFAIAFINNYKAQATTHFEAQKLLTGKRRKAIADREFKFTAVLLDENLSKTTKVTDGYYDADTGLVVFDDISYTEADIDKTYVYELSEVKGQDKTITYSDEKYYASVKVTNPKKLVDGKGVLETEVTYYTDAQCTSRTTTIIFANKYNADSVVLVDNIVKKLNGNNLKANEYEFVLAKEDKTEFAVKNANTVSNKTSITAANNAAGKVSFDALYYTQEDIGHTYTYTIKEKNTKTPGITYDEAVYTVTVKVTDSSNSDGTLSTEVKTYDSEGRDITEMVFTNTYKAKGSITIDALKKVTNGNLIAGFSFSIFDEDGNLAPNAQLKTVENAADGSLEFVLDYTNEDLKETENGVTVYRKSKEFVYYIKEEASPFPGYTKDSRTYKVVVKVADNGSSFEPAVADTQKLDVTLESVAVSEDGSNYIEVADKKIEFTNKYYAEGALEIPGKKTVEHANLTAGFEFGIYDEFDAATGKVSKPSETVEKAQTVNDSQGDFKFTLKYVMSDLMKEDKTYEDSKEFVYYVVEDSQGTAHTNYTVDGTVYKVTVNVTNKNGKLTVESKKTEKWNAESGQFEEAAGGISFVNKYNAAGIAKVTGSKTVKDNDMSGFSFGIYADESCTQKVTDNTVKNDTAVNDEFGNFDFEFTYGMENLKTTEGYADSKKFTYYVKETSTNETNPSYSFDNSVYKVTVTVTNNTVTGKLDTAVKVEKKADKAETFKACEGIEFINKYLAEGEAVLTAGKELTGNRAEAIKDKEFTFTAECITEGRYAGKTFEGSYRSAQEKVVFDAMNYDESDIGRIYVYKLTENKGTDSTITYSEESYYAVVSISNPKKLEDGKGVLETEVTYYEDSALTKKAEAVVFTNAYKATGSASLAGISKKLTGRNLEAGEFKFELTDENGMLIQTVYNKADGSIVFDAFKYTQEDIGKTYVFTVSEVNNGLPGITVYDASHYTVKITVVDDGAGKLKGDVKYYLDNAQKENIVFTNEYKPGSIEFEKYGYYNESCAAAESTIDAKAVKPLEGVIFSLYSASDELNCIATAKSDAKGKVVFDKLLPGEYIIKETKTVDGYILDENVYYATVESQKAALLKDSNNNPVNMNRLINDVYRGNISLTKVDEKQPDKTLAGSTYGLYRLENGKEIFVAYSTTDENGKLLFAGVCMDKVYVVREEKAPDGSYVSEKPVEVVFSVDENGKVTMNSVSTGEGTASVDEVTGEIVWYEPPVEVSFEKIDENGNPVKGAVLAVFDSTGNEVIRFTTDGTVKTVSNTFVVGSTYTLKEISAPEGYELSQSIEFTVSDSKVGPSQNKKIVITMTDKKVIISEEDDTTAKEPVIETGDRTPVVPLAIMNIAALAAITLAGIDWKKKRRKNS